MGPKGLAQSALYPFSAHLQGQKPPNVLELQLCRQKAQRVPPWDCRALLLPGLSALSPQPLKLSQQLGCMVTRL